MKQFQRYFSMDGVELAFTDDALKVIADEAIRHKTGARGLRTGLETALMEVMYDIPGRGDVKKCIVSADTITKKQRPLLVTRGGVTIDPDDADYEEKVEQSA
jgi:ATP-dependent Clp protease ATP-binding subunit ClpX